MSLTKEQWKTFRDTLSWAHGVVHLEVDGYHLRLVVAPYKPLSYVILPYVNGELHPEWIVDECEERRRFFRPYERYLHPEKHRLELLKIWGRLITKEKRAEINRKITGYDWCWRSPASLQRHLIANNQSITFGVATILGWPVKD